MLKTYKNEERGTHSERTELQYGLVRKCTREYVTLSDVLRTLGFVQCTEIQSNVDRTSMMGTINE